MKNDDALAVFLIERTTSWILLLHKYSTVQQLLYQGKKEQKKRRHSIIVYLRRWTRRRFPRRIIDGMMARSFSTVLIVR